MKRKTQKRKSGCIDRLLIILVLLQAAFLCGKLFVRDLRHVSWWVVFAPGYPLAAIFIVAVVAFGLFGYTMSKYG